MTLKYLHTMVRVKDLEKSMAFYELLGLKETRRMDSEQGRFSLVFMAPPGQEDCPVELTYNWDGDDGLPSDSRHFGHLAYRVDDIYAVGHHVYPIKEVILLVYAAQIIEGEPECLGVAAFEWMTRADVAELPFPPADAPVVDRLRREVRAESTPC